MRRFRKLVDKYRHRIYTFAYYCLGSREEAEDVTQEVLLRLWENCQRIDRNRLPGWIVRVTRNACYDALRRRQAYRSVVASDRPGDAVDRAACLEPDPQAQAEASDFRGHLERALSRMAEPYRTIVILREVQDLKYAQISEALGMPLNTIKAYLHRGRRMLRDQLREAVGNDAI